MTSQGWPARSFLPLFDESMMLFQFQLLLHADDLVAILRGLHEVHLLGSLLHAARGLGNELFQLRARHLVDNQGGGNPPPSGGGGNEND